MKSLDYLLPAIYFVGPFFKIVKTQISLELKIFMKILILEPILDLLILRW